jgi:hypothetical protein
MSFQAQAWASKQIVGDQAAKHLLLVLANYANHRAEAWPSINRMARECEMSRMSVIRKIALLAEKGFISKRQVATSSGDFDRNIYTLLIGGSLTEIPPVSDCDGGSLTVIPEPIIEPKLSLSGEDLFPDDDPDPKPPSPSKPRSSSPLPDSWEPTPIDLDWAAEALPTVDVSNETAKFRDHYQSKGELRSDWTKCWRLWLKRAAEYHKRNPVSLHPSRSRPRNADGAREQMAAYLARLRQPVKETP